MTQYLLNVIQPTGGPPPDVDLERIMRDVDAVDQEMKDAGVWVFAGGLHGPEASTVVRADGDQMIATDGPFAEGREHIGGFTIVEAADLDAALDWARKLSKATTLPIEVRPFQEH